MTAPSRRLLAELDRVAKGKVAPKARLLVNPGQEIIPPRKDGGCAGVLWTSSALPMLAPDLQDVCVGLAEGVRARGLDLLLIGKFSDPLRALLGAARVAPWLETEAYLKRLRSERLIAVAPLSRQLSPARQRFADCKSDIKIAQYASSRIAGAYSNSPSFADSDLPRRIVSENSRGAWRDAVIELADTAPNAGNDLADDPAVLARRPSMVAEQFYRILSETAAHGAPFRFWAIPTPSLGRQIESQIRSLRLRLKPTRSAQWPPARET